MTNYQIREAGDADAVALARLVEVLGYKLGAEHVAGRLLAYAGDFSKVFVATQGGKLIGFLSFHAIPLFHEAAMLGRITAMAVDPQHQRAGVGAGLVVAAETFARRVGCLRMEVTSGDRREKDAHVFYAAQGYHSDCRRFVKVLGQAE